MSTPTPSSSSLPTIAIFGATGGCMSHLLSFALPAGHQINALVRSPEKLSSLAAQYPNLRLVKGDIYDLAAIKETLISKTPVAGDGKRTVVDIVISGIGMAPLRKGLSFSFSDPQICENTARNIDRVLTELQAENDTTTNSNQGGITTTSEGPRLVYLSTTGITEKGAGSDVPLLMQPFYKLLLGTPHKDKKAMEGVVRASQFGRWVLIRPSFLMDGKEEKKVRVGVEIEGKVDERGVGYVISRRDVGRWVFEECVGGKGVGWEGKVVFLTY